MKNKSAKIGNIIRCLIIVALSLTLLSVCFACGAGNTESAKKTELEAPTIQSVVYTGEKQTATVAANDGYAVVKNDGGTDVGEYDVVLKLSDIEKYVWKSASANDAGEITLKFAITKANATVTAPVAKTDLVYTGTALALVEAGSAVGGTVKYKSGADGEWKEEIPAATNAGEYTVYYKVVGDKNHNDVAEASVSVTIAKATATLTAPVAKTDLVYTGTALTLVDEGSAVGGTVQYKLGENGEWKEEIPAAKDAGEYTVYYKVVGDKNHNDVAEASVSVTIAKATATLTAPVAKTDLVYTGAAQDLITAGETTFGTLKYSLDGADYSEAIPQGTNAGNYTVYYKVEGTDDYNGAEASVSVTISKANATLTAPVVKTDLVYTGTAQDLITAGETTFGTLKYSLDGADYSEAIPQGTNAGNYTVYYKVEGTDDYNGAEASVSVTISKANATLTAPVVKTDLVYTGTAQDLITAGETTFGTLKYSLDGADYSEAIPQGTNAGNYTVYYKVEGTDDYNGAEAHVEVTIAKAKNEFSITNESLDVKYDKKPAPAVSESAVGDVTFKYVAGTYENEEFTATGEEMTEWSKPTASGYYKCIATAAGNDNYEQGVAEKIFYYTAETLPEYTSVTDDNKTETINALVDYLTYIDTEYTDTEKSAYKEPKKISYLRKYLEGELYELSVTKDNTESSAYNFISATPDEWRSYVLSDDKTKMIYDKDQIFTKTCTIFEINKTGAAYITMPALDYNLFSSVRFCVKSDFAGAFAYSAYDTAITNTVSALFFYIENGTLSVYVQNENKLKDVTLPADVLCGKAGLKIDIEMTGYGSFMITEMRCILNAGNADITDYVAKTYADALIAAEDITTENESAAYEAFVNYLGFIKNNNITESFGIFTMPTDETINALKTKFLAKRAIFTPTAANIGDITTTGGQDGASHSDTVETWMIDQDKNKFQTANIYNFGGGYTLGTNRDITLTLPKLNYALYSDVRMAVWVQNTNSTFQNLTLNSQTCNMNEVGSTVYIIYIDGTNNTFWISYNGDSTPKVSGTLTDAVLRGEEGLTLTITSNGWTQVQIHEIYGVLAKLQALPISPALKVKIK